MIKRMISLLLAIIMVMSLCTVSFASEITTETSQKTETTVTYGMNSSYLVTIPDAVTIDTDDGIGEASVSASNVVIPDQQALQITVRGDSYANGKWHLTDNTNNANKISYEIITAPSVSTFIAFPTPTPTPDPVEPETTSKILMSGSEVFRVASGESWNDTVSTQLVFSLCEDVVYSGNYTDTITFTADLIDANAYDHSSSKLHPTKTIPAGATYTIAATDEVLSEGDAFPSTIADGDIYKTENYEYRYNQYYDEPAIDWFTVTSQNGWGVKCINNVANPGAILESIEGRPITNMSSTFSHCKALKVIPATPANVNNMDYTFSACEQIADFSDLIIPNGVTSLNGTFYSCTSLTSNGLPSIPDTVTSMNHTFERCKSLTDVSSVVIPDGVKSLSSTFQYCESLTNEGMPTIPDSVTSMDGTFGYCSSLTDLSNFVIPSEVKSLARAFAFCTALEYAPEIPESVQTLFYTFYCCESLISSPVVHSGVTNMVSTFENCTSLTGTVIIHANPTSPYTTAYGDCFRDVDFDAQNITLNGSSTMLDTLGATGTNYCTTCDGKCDDSH